MAPVFSKNAILIGKVDYFCLVCETHLKSEQNTVVHISKPVHQKQLEAIQYVEEFQGEGIKKIKNRYFCEICNKLLTVLSRVRLHITEQSHIDNKNIHSFRRVGNQIIVLEKVAISDQSWNGLHENSCAICNIEYDIEEIHRNETAHILNVIQIQVDVDNDQNIYRKIDESSFQCLTCNIVLGLSSLTSHFIEDKHKKLYQACCNAFNKIPLDTKTNKTHQNEATKSESIEKVATKNTPKSDNDLQAKLLKSETKPSEIEPKSEIIKKSSEIEPKSNVNKLSKLSTPTNAKSKENVTIFEYDENEEEKICKQLKCEDYIARDEVNRAWCILCDQVLPDQGISSHVTSRHHQIILKLHKKRLQKMKNNTNQKEKDENTDTDIDCNNILDKLNDFQNNNIRVNLESKTAFCKKCNTHVDFSCNTIENHILEHKNDKKESNIFDLKVVDTKKTLFTSPVHIKSGKDENSKHGVNKKDTSFKNDTPIKKVTSTKDVKKAEEKSAILKALSTPNDKENMPTNAGVKEIKSIATIAVSNSKSKKPKVTLNRVSCKIFIETLTAVQHLMFKDLLVNDKYCINFMSFLFLVNIGEDMFRCQVCEVCFQAHQFEEHIEVSKHAYALNEASVIVNDESEFIREIRSGLFQCGYCNCVETSWEDMEVHLKSASHSESKKLASWRREIYQPRVDSEPFERLLTDRVVMNALIDKFF